MLAVRSLGAASLRRMSSSGWPNGLASNCKSTGLTLGDIHVDAVACNLYHIEEGGIAMR